MDEREQRLRQAVETVVPVLKRPELLQLAGSPPTPDKVVKAFFSEAGLKLWPPQAPAQYSYNTPFPPGSMPPRIVFMGVNDLPWSVVIKSEGDSLVVEGYGMSVTAPLVVRRLTL